MGHSSHHAIGTRRSGPEAELRSRMRATSFLYDDGVVLSFTLRALNERGVLRPSLEAEVPLATIVGDLTPSGFGYLRIGLRTLASQGWIVEPATLDPATTVLRWTEAGRAAAHATYIRRGQFMATFSDPSDSLWSRDWTEAQLTEFADLVGAMSGHRGPHLDAGLAVPALLQLQGTGALLEDGPNLPDDAFGRATQTLFATLGWLDEQSRWTPGGRHARDYAPHFGIVGSYFPMLSRLPELFAGEITLAANATAPDADSTEWHVNRHLNVLASAAAHGRYFADADAVIAGLFDREPVSEQPRFIADMGCGDGSWLTHLYSVVKERTLRGKHLDTDPLVMVAVDFNPAALDPAREQLDGADVPNLTLLGDISDPDALAASLAENDLSMDDGLHIRSFIDHDRIYHGGDPDVPVRGWATGGYVDPRGHALSAHDVERDFVAHLRRWAPHVRKHGIVMLEAHSVAPQVSQHHLGNLHSVAFDSYHGYSHQYPIEYAAFASCCRAAGFERVSHCERRYPTSRPFAAVSLNRLLPTPDDDTVLPVGRPPREQDWVPEPDADLADGRGLHELLYSDGDLRYPQIWCSAPTGYVITGTLDVVEQRLANSAPGDTIRVLDYGTGTGLAAIELLKALRERGLDREFELRDVTFELHLADLPSGWFAMGYELLKDCPGVHFHSLQSADGGFRDLLDVTGGHTMAVVMASMVFHLIPPRAMVPLAANLASVLSPGGRLVWNTPDVGPTQQFAALFHDPNRALRTRWKQLLAQSPVDGTVAAPVRRALQAAANLSEADLQAAQARADRRILPVAQDAGHVHDALSAHLRGRSETMSYEMLDDEFLDALLVPSNQAEFLAEIDDPEIRAGLVRSLMVDEILPALGRGPAGTGHGLNVQWTFGTYVRD